MYSIRSANIKLKKVKSLEKHPFSFKLNNKSRRLSKSLCFTAALEKLFFQVSAIFNDLCLSHSPFHLFLVRGGLDPSAETRAPKVYKLFVPLLLT